MIVNEADTYFELIPQHEHARISAEIIKAWKDEAVRKDSRWNELVYAVREHDRAWIPLDTTPILNKNQKPHSFTDYPETKKIKAYQHGIEAVGHEYVYSGLLVSRHYASFFANAGTEPGRTFFNEESQRQKRWRKQLEEPVAEEFHLRLLQFCDDVSLYACMNDPGAEKEKEVSWFQHGFRQRFAFMNNKAIVARFQGNDKIALRPFPLLNEPEVKIHGRKVWKKDIMEKGITAAFQEGELAIRHFRFISE